MHLVSSAETPLGNPMSGGTLVENSTFKSRSELLSNKYTTFFKRKLKKGKANPEKIRIQEEVRFVVVPQHPLTVQAGRCGVRKGLSFRGGIPLDQHGSPKITQDHPVFAPAAPPPQYCLVLRAYQVMSSRNNGKADNRPWSSKFS